MFGACQPAAGEPASRIVADRQLGSDAADPDAQDGLGHALLSQMGKGAAGLRKPDAGVVRGICKLP
jgi:hypothetical protein